LTRRRFASTGGQIQALIAVTDWVMIVEIDFHCGSLFVPGFKD
jgi:hypothetical protein